jgi:hypothetical protein
MVPGLPFSEVNQHLIMESMFPFCQRKNLFRPLYLAEGQNGMSSDAMGPGGSRETNRNSCHRLNNRTDIFLTLQERARSFKISRPEIMRSGIHFDVDR